MSAPTSEIRLCEAARRSFFYTALKMEFAEGCECDPEDLCECLHRRTLRFLLASPAFLSAFFAGVKREHRETADWPTLTLSSWITLQSAPWKDVGWLELTGAHLPEGSAFSLTRLLRVAALESVHVQVGSLDEADPEMDLASEHHDDRMAVLNALKTHSTLQSISLGTGVDDDEEEVNELLAEMPDKIVSFYSSSFDQCAIFKDRKTVMDEVDICGHAQPESSAIVETFQVPCRRFKAFGRMRSLNDAFTITLSNEEVSFVADVRTMDELHTRSLQLVDCAHEAGVRIGGLINGIRSFVRKEENEAKMEKLDGFLESKQTEAVAGLRVGSRTFKKARQLEHRGAKIVWPL
ncbi:hypothetical protein M3Y99_00641700 [Aphelenchoides fujianensis]|nr:hypothetical protein M3Y99_00641700 [Aphelenchoides fujianensis]